MGTDTLTALRQGQLSGAQRLDLQCNLEEFPHEIFALADTLEILNLSNNALDDLPKELPLLRELRILFCSNNRFTHIPEVLGACLKLSMVAFKSNRIVKVSEASLPPTLRWLILTDNAIEELPESIGNCTPLQKLMLSGNRLQSLPETLSKCRNLELLRLAANQLPHLPDWLLSMPRLSWLAYSGNPFSDRSEMSVLSCHHITDIPWTDLAIGPKLGEGASGEIFQAELSAEGGSQSVAVKLFKGAVTSDGLPHSEMDACISAGAHPNLIPIWGKLVGHPTSPDGLVMSLVPGDFTSLAGPPSFQSCTRDVYSASDKYSLETVLGISSGIASAVNHLHSQGVMHGDLYAHNILHNGSGKCLLGDFGAASFFDSKHPHAEALQRLEVRAFGCLLEELLSNCGDASEMIRSELNQLVSCCFDEDVSNRPLFTEVCATLEGLQAPCQSSCL